MKRYFFIAAAGMILLAACHGRSNEASGDSELRNSPPKDISVSNNNGLSLNEQEDSKSDSVSSWSGSSNVSANSTVVNLTDASGATGGMPADQTKSQVQIKIPTKIIKTANLRFSVLDYKKSRAAIDKLVHVYDSYVGSEQEQNNTYSLSNTMTIRVASKDFDNMVNGLSGIASEINEKNVNAQDVTSDYVDTYVRMNTKKEVLKRYTDILHRAGTIQDILDVEDKIRIIQEEIESKEGTLKLMNDQVGYSTVNLTFYQTISVPTSENPGYFTRLTGSFVKGWEGLEEFTIAFFSAWPMWIILSVIGFFFYRIIKKTLKNTKTDGSTSLTMTKAEVK